MTVMRTSLLIVSLVALLAGAVTVLGGAGAKDGNALLVDAQPVSGNVFTTGCFATFAQDSFTDTDGTGLGSHTPELGNAWIAVIDDGAAKIDSNNVTTTSSTEILWRADAAPCDNSYAVSVDAQTGSSDSGSCAGPVGRLVDADNYYRVRLCGDGDVTLEKVVAGGVTSLGSYSISGFNTTTFYTIKLEITNATKKVFVDGTERVSSTDNALTAAGSPGIRHEGGATMRGDNFVASQVP